MSRIADNRHLIRGVRFATYHALRTDLDDDGDRARLTSDRGTLEIKSPQHIGDEGAIFLIGQIVVATAMEFDIPFRPAKSSTLARANLDRGIDPDDSYSVANEPRVRSRDDIRLPDDPPPDLVVEVDSARSRLDKPTIYATLGVREFWRLDSGRFEILSLDAGGHHRPVDASPSLPMLVRSDVEGWLRRSEAMGSCPGFVGCAAGFGRISPLDAATLRNRRCYNI